MSLRFILKSEANSPFDVAAAAIYFFPEDRPIVQAFYRPESPAAKNAPST